MTVAATVISPEQVRKRFSKDLTRAGYIVVEVAVFPEPGTTADFSSDEFTLSVGTDATILPAQTPRSVARGDKSGATTKSKPPQLPGNVHVYQTETIGYESGGYGRRGGVYTASSTAVGIGDPRNAPQDPRACDPTLNDPRTGNDPRMGGDPRMGRAPGAGCPPAPDPRPSKGKVHDAAGLQKELEELALPEGRTAVPVAGYLYFLKPSTKEKNPYYHLAWYRVSDQIRLTLPPPK